MFNLLSTMRWWLSWRAMVEGESLHSNKGDAIISVALSAGEGGGALVLISASGSIT